MDSSRARPTPSTICAERRRRLLDRLGPRAIAILPGAPLAYRNNDVEHEYRQDSDLYYVTGFDEPESLAVITPQHPDHRFVLFVRPRDKDRETWEGPRAGVEGAVAGYGADAAFPIGDLAGQLPKYLENVRRVYGRLGRDRAADDGVLRAIDAVRARARHGVEWPTEIVDPAALLHEMRLVKDDDEIARMRRAAEVTAEAFARAHAETRPGRWEYEIEAVLRHAFRTSGSERPAYPPIVGSGPNATILHYTRNDRQMRDGELLLIDAGAEFAFYACDVTRTYPVGRAFSRPQRAIYEIVLAAQEAAIAATRPGATLEQIHQRAVDVVSGGLLDLGILEGDRDEAIEQGKYKPYFMHRTSHWLGLDVHDAGRYYVDGRPRNLGPGMVITVEPGVYFPPDCADIPAEYRGIGVRIEDDVLVTAGAPDVLTAAIAKKPAELERG